MHSDIACRCCKPQRLSQAVAECVDAQVPESVIRQVGENEYQAKLHELQLKVGVSPGRPQLPLTCCTSSGMLHVQLSNYN